VGRFYRRDTVLQTPESHCRCPLHQNFLPAWFRLPWWQLQFAELLQLDRNDWLLVPQQHFSE
jgi:hypothetical protein